MEPRLKISKKWTPLPKELIQQIESLLAENFPEHEINGDFIIEGRIYPTELLFRLGYLIDKSLKQENFEVSIAYQVKKDNLMSLIHLAVDACASFFSQWADDKDSKPTLDWQEFEFENQILFVRYSTVNSRLEEEADKLLGENHNDLVTEEEDIYEDELQHKISILGLNDDDDGQTH